MTKKILVTGGAGFIGSHLVDRLISDGNDVRVLDNLEKQVHVDGKIPSYFNSKAEFIEGDVRKTDDLRKAIADVEVVYHLAARVGVGQSMYEINNYVETNTFGTAKLLDLLVNGENSVKKIVVAGSMSEYGEGSYNCGKCGLVIGELRSEGQMSKGEWELKCRNCNAIIEPIPTSEEKPLQVNSIYATTKRDQEEMVMEIGDAYGINSTSLRFFNVYGPRQSLSNPYTGVAAIFLSRMKNNQSPIVYEDGLQSRDFVWIGDIVDACVLAMDSKNAEGKIYNVGSGDHTTILNVAETINKLLGKDIRPKVMGKFRKGDVRHCFSDISKIKNELGFSPKVNFEQGMKELVEWGEKEEAIDMFEKAEKELESKGLVD
ncbi:MAG: SDR family NAD(P)-dependent oxidoreductase [Candidatus Diapherotrites archaeon]